MREEKSYTLEQINDIKNVDKIGNISISKNDNKIGKSNSCNEVCDKNSILQSNTDNYEERIRASIKIEDGCDEYCTYCIIPYLRGHVKSRDDNDIIKDVKEHLKKGVKEIVLTGIHLSSFGLDRENINYENKDAISKARDNLLSLINKIVALKEEENLDLKRIRLGSLEPRIIDENFIEKLSTKPISEVFCPSFCLSLQSGSNRILKLMNRHYMVEDFEKAVEIIRKYFSLAFITTDIIVGFPGETDDDFAETLKVVDRCQYDGAYTFIYSERKGTVSSLMKDNISQEIKEFVGDRQYETLSISAGIGLFMAKQIIMRQNGNISVESTEGQGTTFTIKIPDVK